MTRASALPSTAASYITSHYECDFYHHHATPSGTFALYLTFTPLSPFINTPLVAFIFTAIRAGIVNI